jgi:hypothetical protein
MSIIQTTTTSFKQDVLLAVHNLNVDTLKMALYTANADLNASTTVYGTAEEVVGTGYTAGGIVLTGVSVSVSGTTAFVTFENAVWDPASFTARCALIYNFSKSDKAIAVLDFGADKTAAGTFTVQMPANTATTALIRFV